MKNNNDSLNSDRFFVFFIFSIILHFILGYFCIFGLPSFYRKLPEEQVIVFQMLPVSEKSNVPTIKNQHEKAIENEDAKQVKQSKPIEQSLPVIEKPTPPVLPIEKVQPLEEKPIIPPVIPEKTPIEEPAKIPEEVKPIEKKLDNVEEKPKEKLKEEKPKEEKPKIEEKKIEEKKPEEKKQIETTKKVPEGNKPKEIKKKILNKSDLDSLLKNLEQSSEGNNKKSNKQALSEQSKETKESKGTYDETLPLSINEIALMQEQIIRRWAIPPTAVGEVAEIIVSISFNKDGIVQKVIIKDKNCYALSNSVCQALEESAKRAVWLASPIEGLNPERYNSWKEFNLRFDPSKM